MNEMKVARGLGWFSLGLGLVEVAAGKSLSRALGMEDRTWLVQAYGVREIATGVGIFAMDNPRPMMWARVAGDVLDIATLATAYRDDNPKKDNVAIAIGSVLGVTLADYWCARRLASARPHGSIRTHQKYVADGSAPHYREEAAKTAS